MVECKHMMHGKVGHEQEVNAMVNQEQVERLKQGVTGWNQWRQENADIRIDLSDANLRGANLSRAILTGAYLREANLIGADLTEADLTEADFVRAYLSGAYLSGADLSYADLSYADLSRANLSRAILRGANLRRATLVRADFTGADLSGATLNEAKLSRTNLSRANLSGANLSRANLSGATLSGANLSKTKLDERDLSRKDLSKTNLSGAQLVRVNLTEANLMEANLQGATLNEALLIKTNLQGADLSDCSIHGISVWNARLEGATQSNLVITSDDEPIITVDSLEVAQFIYLLLNNTKIRQVIDTITSKVVLILGRFSQERKPVLDAIREELRKQNYLPVLFDFEKPASQTMTETIRTLAHLARFIIVDITDPRSVPAELETIVRFCFVPVQPLLETPFVVVEEKVTEKHMFEESTVVGNAYALFLSLQLFPWVLPIFHYQNVIELLSSLKEHVIDPAEQKAKELARQK